jgi:hypothetical protein
LDEFLKFVSPAAEFSRGHAETRGVFLPRPAGEGGVRENADPVRPAASFS